MPADFETRYEYLRPAQLLERCKACPLVIVPVGPLEYHGPHLPIGVDAINCTQVAHACCRRLGRGVVLPTMMMGTERERGPEMLEPLGFEPGTYVVGMDFPSRLWNSHYLPEEIFAIRLRAELRILIDQGYRYILIANGHGAQNQLETINRLCIELSNTTPAKLTYRLTLAKRVLAGNWAAGHADSIETSIIMHYDRGMVDLGATPAGSAHPFLGVLHRRRPWIHPAVSGGPGSAKRPPQEHARRRAAAFRGDARRAGGRRGRIDV